MAKRVTDVSEEKSTPSEARSTQEVIGGFAEDLGTLLGHARNKAEDWLGQKESIVKQLTQLRDEASSLLGSLGHEAQRVVRRGRPAGSRNVAKPGPGRPRVSEEGGRREMSAAARARISAAQKARWAKQKAGEQ